MSGVMLVSLPVCVWSVPVGLADDLGLAALGSRDVLRAVVMPGRDRHALKVDGVEAERVAEYPLVRGAEVVAVLALRGERRDRDSAPSRAAAARHAPASAGALAEPP